jgi:penicillin-binding protein 1A
MRTAAYWASVASVWALIGATAFLGYFALDMPAPSSLWSKRLNASIAFVDANGKPLATTGVLYGAPVELDAISPFLVDAVIAAEDRRFRYHFGVDPFGLARAAARNASEGRIVQGGSTITQQLAKNLFLTSERTIKRKIQEVMLAIWLEASFTKDEILTLYLNRVYFGAGAYGIEAASLRYFGKSAQSLTLSESAMMAGLLKAPSRYNPRNNMAKAQERAQLVLRVMLEAGFIDDAQRRHADSHAPAVAAIRDSRAVQYFVDWVAEQIPSFVGRHHEDLVVKTTLHLPFQRLAEATVKTALDENGTALNVHQAALLSIDKFGAVRAMVGGRSYGKSQFNRAVQARRQPGSAFKPFVYLAALEKGLQPWSVFEDAPITVANWSPTNFKDEYHGPVTMEEALSRSINTVAVRVAENVGRPQVISTAGRLGIKSQLRPLPSLALGAQEVSLIELSAAYVPFANGGFGVMPHAILEIKTRAGEVLYRREGSGIGRIANDKNIGALNSMLAATMQTGTGKSAWLVDRPSAGKTGTSQAFRDAWFMGYTADLVTGVWVGNDDGAPMNRVTGGGLPAWIWRDYMSKAAKAYPLAPLPGVDNAETRETRTASGGGFFDRLLSRISSNLGPEPAAAEND